VTISTLWTTVKPAVVRLLRAGVAYAFPIFISWLAGQADTKWAAVGPVIQAVAKYLRNVYKWGWLPV